MAYKKRDSFEKESTEKKDYTERFEFVFSYVNAQSGDRNIICKRFFKIGGFNELSVTSSRLRDSLIRCAKRINNDLIDKSNVYTRLMAPKCFSTEKEMLEYTANPNNTKDYTPGEGIVIREESAPNYVWGNDKVKLCPSKFNKYEFTHKLTEDDETEFILEFIDHATFVYDEPTKKDPCPKHIDEEYGDKVGRIVCAYSWKTVLPKIVKMSIDLSNKYKVNKEEVSTLDGDAWVYYKLSENRSDLIYPIIKDICTTCCVKNDAYYTKADPWGEETSIQAGVSANVSKALSELIK